MHYISACLLCLVSSGIAECGSWNLSSDGNLDWWQTTVIYQIYPLSFKDSNGDGYGDIKGITQNIQHLKNLGVDAVWISPLYKSPMKDFGYDVSSYTDINPIFGDMEDFQQLVKKMKELDIKLIMDFVPNHSSDECEWFLKSVQNDTKYRDYYVWADPTYHPSTQVHLPPNNWLSAFGGPAWKYNSVREQYYLHQFSESQPDLNLKNEDVVKELLNAMKFWLDRGVDGFRMDAVNHMIEDGRLLDEPIRQDSGTSDPNNYNYLNHIYTTDLPETLDLLAHFRQFLDKYSASTDNTTRLMITESYTTTQNLMKQYGNATHPIAHFPFNFKLIDNLELIAEDFDLAISEWMDSLPHGAWPNWVLGNHDNRRVGSRFGPNLIDAMNMILMLLPGTAVTYYGEEIGMLDNNLITYNETQDPLGIQAGPDNYKRVSRDPQRTPFQWRDSTLGGFSNGSKPWLPVNINYRYVNVHDQTSQPKSHYSIYKQLVNLRKLPVLQKGNLAISSIGTPILAFKRFHEEESTGVVFIVNFGEDVLEGVNIGYALDIYETKLKVNITTGITTYKLDEVISSDDIRLNPLEAVVFTYEHHSSASLTSISSTVIVFIFGHFIFNLI